MLFTDNTLRSEEIRDFSDLAASFIRDVRHGFICRADGNGMKLAGIRSGDYLLFTKDSKAENGDIVYLEVYGQPMCRRIFFEPLSVNDPGKIRIRREDGITPDLIADKGDVRIVGVFAGLVRNSRKKKEKVYHYLSPAQAKESVQKERGTEKKEASSGRQFLPESRDPSMPISSLGLPVRLVKRLSEIGIHTAQDILDIPDKEAMLAIPGLGKRSYEGILEALDLFGFDARHLYW